MASNKPENEPDSNAIKFLLPSNSPNGENRSDVFNSLNISPKIPVTKVFSGSSQALSKTNDPESKLMEVCKRSGSVGVDTNHDCSIRSRANDDNSNGKMNDNTGALAKSNVELIDPNDKKGCVSKL